MRLYQAALALCFEIILAAAAAVVDIHRQVSYVPLKLEYSIRGFAGTKTWDTGCKASSLKETLVCKPGSGPQVLTPKPELQAFHVDCGSWRKGDEPWDFKMWFPTIRDDCARITTETASNETLPTKLSWDVSINGIMQLLVSCLPLSRRSTWEEIVKHSEPQQRNVSFHGSFLYDMMGVPIGAKVYVPVTAWTLDVQLQGGVAASDCFDALERIYGWEVEVVPQSSASRKNCGALRRRNPDLARSPQPLGTMEELCPGCTQAKSMTLWSIKDSVSYTDRFEPVILKATSEPPIPEQELKQTLSWIPPGSSDCFEEEAASRSQVDTEWKLFNALMDVGKTSTVYQELRVNASLLRQGTHKVSVQLEFATLEGGMKHIATMEIATEGTLKNNFVLITVVVILTLCASLAFFLWRRQRLISSDAAERRNLATPERRNSL